MKATQQLILFQAMFFHSPWCFFFFFFHSSINLKQISFFGTYGLKKNRMVFLLDSFTFFFQSYSGFKTVFAVYTFVQEGKRLPIDENCPTAEIIKQCWAQARDNTSLHFTKHSVHEHSLFTILQDPRERPSFDEVVPLLEALIQG